MELFNQKNRATCRKADPQTSQDAADALNAVDAVTRQEKAVLAAVRKYSGHTARELGIYMARDATGFPIADICNIIRIAGQPHRRLSAMLADETVTINEKREYTC